MKKAIALLLLASCCIVFSCSSPKNTNLAREKKFFVQPVHLSVHGIEKDTSIQRLFEEAFAKYKVELITFEEMKIKVEKEAMRVAQKIFTKDSKFDNAEDILRAMNREQNYVANLLSVNLELHDKDDSLMIYKVWWNNIPFPPDYSRMSAPKQREINLINLSYSIKENVHSIVDSIIYSKDLK